MKKFMVVLAALVFGTAMLFAQTSEVKNTTFDLIEDGAIDSLAFGIEEKEGLSYIQFNEGAAAIDFGWGKWLSDSFWLSIYENYNKNAALSNGKSVSKTYGVKDGINIDYIDNNINDNKSGNFSLYNTLGLGLGFGNFGTQIVWNTNTTINNSGLYVDNGENIVNFYNGGDKETNNTPSGTKTIQKYDNIKNFTSNNTFTFNFDGAGVEGLGDANFYAKLNSVSFGWNNTTKASDYSNVTTVYGKETSNISTSLSDIQNLLTPGLSFELGFDLPSNDYVEPKLVFEDSFAIGFKADKRSKKHTKVTDSLSEKETIVTDYSIKPGKYLKIENTLTPKCVFDFNFSDALTLKAQVAAGISFTNTNTKAGTYEYTQTTTTLTKASGESTVHKVIKTASYGDFNTNNLIVSLTPDYSLGLVYEVKPGKMNLNFGIDVTHGSYSWTLDTNENPNINTVTITEDTDKLGNTTGSKTVSIANTNSESKTSNFNASNSGTGLFHIGGTWFFSENVKLDAYYGNSFTNLLAGSNIFGIDLCVLF